MAKLRRDWALRLLLGLMGYGLLGAIPVAPGVPVTYLTKWGYFGAGDGQFNNPSQVAVDTAGNVYVADYLNHRIQKFDRYGNFIRKWGGFGTAPGQLKYPTGLHVDDSGDLYVADRLNNRIQKFDGSGALIQIIGAGYLYFPYDVVVSPLGTIYVADTFNHQIQKFDSNGNFLGKWGSFGSGPGQFKLPFSIVLDSSGNVYVGEEGNYRIQKFDSGGNFIRAWGSQGMGPGQFGSLGGPFGLQFDSAGILYASDGGNHRIQTFDTDGNFIFSWGSLGAGDGQFNIPAGLAIGLWGDLYVGEAGNHRVQKFLSLSPPPFHSAWGSFGSGDGQFNGTSHVAVDAVGNVYVTDYLNHRIQKFDRYGNFLLKWGGLGSNPGQLRYPTGLHIDGSGHLYVADRLNSRIQKFDLNGNLLQIIGAGHLLYPYDVVVSESGTVYIADTFNNQVQKFDGSGNFIAKWGSYGANAGQFYLPVSIALDAAENVYVGEERNHRVQKFDSDGNFITLWGGEGTGDGQFGGPNSSGQIGGAFSIEFDKSGQLYVTDTANHRIQKFDTNGNFILSWGSFGSGNGQFNTPIGLATGSWGDIYVADYLNNRITKFGFGWPNQAPVANGGLDQSIRVGSEVCLDGSDSYDDNTASSALQYDWQISTAPTGSSASLTAPDTATPCLIVDAPGTFVLTLVVTDENGLASTPDNVELSSDNLAPRAVAVADPVLAVIGNPVRFDGTGSTDPENDPLSFQWSISSAPAGSLAQLTDANTSAAMLIPDLAGIYEVSLIVSDSIGAGTPAIASSTATSAEGYTEIVVVDTGTIIAELPPVEVTTPGNQNALTNFLGQVLTAIEEGDIEEAILKLRQAIERTDGCALRGTPDGNGPGRDWITDCSTQGQAYPPLVAALGALLTSP